MGAPLSQKTFIARCLAVHGGRYDYSLVVYTLSAAKVTIICPDHGPFEQTADLHQRGGGCRKCANEAISERTLINIAGKRFGKLVVLRRESNGRRKHWLCRCDCGTEKLVQSGGLIDGSTSSCGCARGDLISKANKRHGRAGKGDPTYQSWLAMQKRCDNPNDHQAARYKNRGITVCDEWRDFTVFLSDMGERPEGKTLDRINNDKGYCKENCRWATPREQSLNRGNNRLITALGKTRAISEWSRECGVSIPVISSRLARGWPPEKAVTNLKK